MATTRDYLTTALRELGIADLTGDPAPELLTTALGVVNRILDEWNAQRGAVYADVHSPLYALASGLNPHTIGDAAHSPTWDIGSHRPVSIEGIRLTADNGVTFLPPMRKQDAAWWHALAAPESQSDYPTDFYYDPTWPNGSIYFYPRPGSSVVKAQLWYRIALANLALNDTVSMPPGYQSALTETLKEKLTEMPMFASLASEGIKDAARRARAIAFGNNSESPTLVTADSGLGGGNGVYDWRIGPYSFMRHG